MRHENPMHFLKFLTFEEYNENDDHNCVGVFQFRIYEDENGIYSLHDAMWDNTSKVDPVLRETQMLCEILESVSQSMLIAVDPDLVEFDDTENPTLQ